MICVFAHSYHSGNMISNVLFQPLYCRCAQLVLNSELRRILLVKAHIELNPLTTYSLEKRPTLLMLLRIRISRDWRSTMHRC